MLELIIADDEYFALEQLSQLINWSAHGVRLAETFTTGEAVISYISSHTVDIIISDIQMPGVSGIDIAKYCQRHLPHVQVILISAFREFEYAQAAIKYGVKDYVTKPYSKEQILDIIARIKLQHQVNSADKDNSFMNNIRCQTLFSDIFCGNIAKEDIGQKLSDFGIPDASGVLLSLEIAHLEEYLNTKWKYGKSRFFDALSMVIFRHNPSYCFCMAYAHDNTLLIASLGADGVQLDLYCKELAEALHSIFFVDYCFKNTQEFQNLSELYGLLNPTDQQTHEYLVLANEFLEQNYMNDISLDDVASHIGLSRKYFSAVYKKLSGENFAGALQRKRMDKAVDLLLHSSVKVSAVNELVGYNSRPYFYKLFKSTYGITPAEYKEIYCNGESSYE